MPDPIMIGGLLEPGLRAEAAQVYWPIYNNIMSQIGDVAWLNLTSDKLQEVYGFLEAPPYWTWWPDSTPPPSGSIKSQRFVVPNRDFARRVYLPRNVEDDQTGTAFQFARGIATTYAYLPEQIFFQIMQNQSYNGTTRPFPFIPLSADGNGLYFSGSRYGVSTGNIVSQTGNSTTQQIFTDIFSVKARFINFQNTQTQPFWDPPMVNNMTLFYGPSNTQVMDQARTQTLSHSVVGVAPSGVAGGAAAALTGAAVTNPINEAGMNLRFINTQRISGAQYYCWLQNVIPAQRALWRQIRKGYTEWQGNFVTSDHTRDTGQQYVQGDAREGWTSVLALSTVSVQ